MAIPRPSAPEPSSEAGATSSEPSPQASHVAMTPQGPRSRMVDVGEKPVSARSAVARARVRFSPGVLERVLAEGGPKGPITEVARAAGILAAKRTSEWIPMCHLLPLDHVELGFEPLSPGLLEIRCRAACTARTGVEMEALVGACAAALTVYDMTKALDRAISIERVELVEKHGGRSGSWQRSEP